MNKAQRLAQCTVTGNEANVNARRCTSDKFDGVSYEFEAKASIDVRAVIEEIKEWDGQAIEQMSVPPSAEKWDFVVFVADIPETSYDDAFVL